MSTSSNPFSPDERALNPFASPVIAAPDISEVTLGRNPFEDDSFGAEPLEVSDGDSAAPEAAAATTASAELGRESAEDQEQEQAASLPDQQAEEESMPDEKAAAEVEDKPEAGNQEEEASGEIPTVDVVQVGPPTFAADMARGCAALLESGRYSDLIFVTGDGASASESHRAHRVVLELRCGAALMQARWPREKGGAGGARPACREAAAPTPATLRNRRRSRQARWVR